MIPVAGGIGFAVGGGQTPLFAMFGSIALLIIVDFPGNRAGRAVSYAGLGVIGALLITLGTLVAPIPWLAVTTTFVLGVTVTFAGVLSTAIAAAQRATLLPFVLPACTPPGPIPERLLGWCIALARVRARRLVPAAASSPRRPAPARREGVPRAGAPAGRSRTRQRRHRRRWTRCCANFLGSDYRPVRPDRGQSRAGPRGRRPGLVVRSRHDDTAATLGVMRDPAVRVLRDSARLLRIARVADRAPDRAELDEALAELRVGGP